MLLIDMSSSTGNVAISIAQLLPNSQILVVTTPWTAAAEVTERTGSIVSQTQQCVISTAGNMSYLPQLNGSRLEPLGSSGDASVSARLSTQLGYETPLPAQVPLDIALHGGGDMGRPVTLGDDPVSQASSELAEKLSTAEWGLSGRLPGVSPVQG